MLQSVDSLRNEVYLARMITGDEFRGERGLVLDVAHELVGDEDVDTAGPQHVDVSQLGERQAHQRRDLHAHLVTGQRRKVDSLVDQRRVLHAHIHGPAHIHSKSTESLSENTPFC